MSFLASISILGIFYAYFGYFIIMFCLHALKVSKFNKTKTEAKDIDTFSIIIAARNEEKVINNKIKDSLALTWKGRTVESLLKEGSVQLIVASDASDDDTHSIVKKFSAQKVELIASKERNGKEAAQKGAVLQAKGDVILFTDAKINLPVDILDKLENHFKDPNIGLVSSVDQVQNEGEGGSGEGMYVKYEMMLRKLEASFYSLIGVSGSCFAVRKEIAQNIVPDIPSDFCLLLEGIKQGYRGEHADDIIATYKSVRTEKEEFGRKVRTVLRGMCAFFARTEFLNFSKYGLFSWMLISHKLCRWLVPIWAVVILLFIVPLSFTSNFWLLILVMVALFLLLAYQAYKDPSLQKNIAFKACLFLFVVNAGIFVAWTKFLTGQRAVVWNPSKKGGVK